MILRTCSYLYPGWELLQQPLLPVTTNWIWVPGKFLQSVQLYTLVKEVTTLAGSKYMFDMALEIMLSLQGQGNQGESMGQLLSKANRCMD